MFAATEPARSPNTGPKLYSPPIAPIFVISTPPTGVQAEAAKATGLGRMRLLGTNDRSEKTTPVKASTVITFLSFIHASLSEGRVDSRVICPQAASDCEPRSGPT